MSASIEDPLNYNRGRAISQAVENTPKREKYWSEKTPEEKMETLRECVIEIGRTQHGMLMKIDALLRHQHHAADGRLMVPLDRHPGELWDRKATPRSLRNKDES